MIPATGLSKSAGKEAVHDPISEAVRAGYQRRFAR